MSLKERTINVDIMTKEYTKLKYKQGDSNQTLKFKFYKNGSELDLTGYVAGIFYEKPNNEVLEKTGNISSNTVTTTITSGVLNTPGVVKTEIFLTKNDEVSISFTILIEVETSIDKNAAVQEKEEWDAIKDLLINSNNVSMIDDSSINTNKTWSSSKISSQINIIENEMENIGKPTDEQVASIINAAIANGDIVAGSMSTTAQNLLIAILRSAVYTSDQSTNITSLSSALTSSGGGGSGTTQYVITNNLSNATTSNSTTLVDANSSYTSAITVNSGYTLNTITVTMGATDITSTAVSGATITISAVTGNVVITVTTTATSSGGGGSTGGLVTDGLVNYFDFRTATYNNNGSGGSTIISATQGNGSLYTWATNMVETQDDHGMIIKRSMIYNPNSVGTTTGDCGTTFTWIFKCYMDSTMSPLFSTAYASSSNISGLAYKPKYNTSSGTAQVTAKNVGGRGIGYHTYIITVDENICKLYKDATLLETVDGSTISDFTSWYDNLTMAVLGSNTAGHYSQVAVYNKALSEVEIVDMVDYLTTLEVK